MALPVARKKLIENVLSDLGRQFRSIEVSVEQIDDAITETAQLFCEYCTDAREPGKIIYEITDADIASGFISLPSSVMYVKSVHTRGAGSYATLPYPTSPHGNLFMTGGPSGRAFILPGTNMAGLDTVYWTHGPRYAGHTLSSIIMTKQMLGTMTALGGGEYQNVIRYNSITNKLHIGDMEVTAGQTVLMNVEHKFESLYGPDEDIPHYGLKWFENHVGLLTLSTWYQNMSKYGSVTLPGGTTIDFEAKAAALGEKISASVDELIERYSFHYGHIWVQ